MVYYLPLTVDVDVDVCWRGGSKLELPPRGLVSMFAFPVISCRIYAERTRAKAC